MDQELQQNPDHNSTTSEQTPTESVSANYQANYDSNSGTLYPLGRRKSRKLLSLLFLVGIVIVGFAIFRVYRNIVGPLAINLPDWVVEEIESNQPETIEDLQNRDTDQDGLTDYQELYQFQTSMFLEDTDSDGWTDYEEVNSGEDPLCPIGESCNLLRLITPKTRLSDIVQDVNLDPDTTIQEAALEEFRKFLAENGMSEEDLAILTDDDLLAIFSAYEESNVIPQDTWNSTTTPEQVRAFLLTQPDVDTDGINQLTEEELLEIRDRLISGDIY